jgi:DNA-binding XRE family transcriptional regulator
MSEKDEKLVNKPAIKTFDPEIEESFELSSKIDELGEQALDDETAFELANAEWQERYANNKEYYDQKLAEERQDLPITGARERLKHPLKVLRTRAKLTKAGLAEKSTIPLHMIEMLEEGEYYITERLLRKIAPALEVEAEVLIKLARGQIKSLTEVLPVSKENKL